MEITVSRVENIQLGRVIAQDVFANTKTPIIAQNTIVRSVHLLVLKHFKLKRCLLKILRRNH